MDIMERVRTITEGRVTIGPGTLYNLLENFQKACMIRETKVEGRKRSYILTNIGRQALEDEVARMSTLINDFQKMS